MAGQWGGGYFYGPASVQQPTPRVPLSTPGDTPPGTPQYAQAAGWSSPLFLLMRGVGGVFLLGSAGDPPPSFAVQRALQNAANVAVWADKRDYPAQWKRAMVVQPGATPTGPFGPTGQVPCAPNFPLATGASWKTGAVADANDYVWTCSNPATAAGAQWKKVSALVDADYVGMVDNAVTPTVAAWLQGPARTI